MCKVVRNDPCYVYYIHVYIFLNKHLYLYTLAIFKYILMYWHWGLIQKILKTENQETSYQL